MLEHGRPIPRLVDRLRVIVAKFKVILHFNFTKDELPTRESAHGGDEAQTGVKPFDNFTLLGTGELPALKAVIGDLGVEYKQLDELFVAVVGVVVEGFATTIGWR